MTANGFPFRFQCHRKLDKPLYYSTVLYVMYHNTLNENRPVLVTTILMASIISRCVRYTRAPLRLVYGVPFIC